MTFEDLKKDKHINDMLLLTINRIRYINYIQLPDDILKDFFVLLEAGGFTIEPKKKVDTSSWFYKNCKRQRKDGAKICNCCPFRNEIEHQEINDNGDA